MFLLHMLQGISLFKIFFINHLPKQSTVSMVQNDIHSVTSNDSFLYISNTSMLSSHACNKALLLYLSDYNPAVLGNIIMAT